MAEQTAVVDQIRSLITPTLSHLRFDLYDLKLAGGRGQRVLRVTIDRPEGVTLDDCERVSQSLSALLDQTELLPDPYELEVSSPGAERPLRTPDEFRRFLGKRANLRYRVGDQEQVSEGRLIAVSTDTIELQLRDGKRERLVAVPFRDLLAARLAVEF
jgi:ribosome maturation factor RimP